MGKLTQNKSSASDEQASILVNNNTTPLNNQPSASKIEGNKLSSSFKVGAAARRGEKGFLGIVTPMPPVLGAIAKLVQDEHLMG